MDQVTLTKLANAAFKRASLKVLECAERTGTPVIVWEDGAVKAVPARRFRGAAWKDTLMTLHESGPDSLRPQPTHEQRSVDESRGVSGERKR